MNPTHRIVVNYFDDTTQLATLDHFQEHGWSQHGVFLPAELSLALAAECRSLQADGVLASAGVGRAQAQSLNTSIRGDQIAWLHTGQSAACDQYLAMMEDLRVVLNREFFLGLDSFESHFAFYVPGAFYVKHFDRFRDDDSRAVSVVIYLNQDWLPENGGALRLHPHGKCSEDIAPMASHMVLFLSAEMLHEVLPATRDRLSLTGWFRRRPM